MFVAGAQFLFRHAPEKFQEMLCIVIHLCDYTMNFSFR
jgi:hypothetical protein